MNFDLCSGISYFWEWVYGAERSHSESWKHCKAVVKLGEPLQKVKISVGSSENKNRVVGYSFFFLCPVQQWAQRMWL